MVSQWLARLAPDYAGQLVVAKVDVTEDQTIAEQFDVQSLPALLWLENGIVLHRQLDEINEGGLRQWVNRLLNKHEE